MSPSEEQAAILLAKARDDLTVAVELAGNPGMPSSIIGFHCHQATEKSMKAVLAAEEAEYPRTHDLAFLVELLAKIAIQPPLTPADLRYLGPWATEYRYDEPGDTDLDRPRATALAQRAVEWAGDKLNPGPAQ